MANEIIKEDFAAVISGVGRKKLESFGGKYILIVGSTGFIGRSLTAFFEHLNTKLKKPINLVLLKGDITKNVKTLPGVDYVFHLAAITSPRVITEKPVDSLRVNIIGTDNILRAIGRQKLKKFLYFSSGAVYGNPGSKNIPTSEDFNGSVSPISSRSAYAEGKRAGEALVMAYHRQYGLPVNILRPAHIYGPLMDLSRDNALNYFMSCGLRGEDIVIRSAGRDTRSFCYISDALSIILLAALTHKSGEVFNVGNEATEVKMTDLAKKIKKAVHGKMKIITQKAPQAGFLAESLTRNMLSMRKVKEVLGYIPRVSLREGISRIIKSRMLDRR